MKGRVAKINMEAKRFETKRDLLKVKKRCVPTPFLEISNIWSWG